MKKGLLLINLGTPDNCDPNSVRRYLREFLNDPRVVDLPWIIRWPLINLVITPTRYKKSAQAYQAIWQAEGSPLLINTHQLTEALADRLKDDYQVEMGMRYGNPGIETALAKLKGVSELTVLPLFPQYSSAATGSAIEKVLHLIAQETEVPSVNLIKDFFNADDFVSAYTKHLQSHLKDQNVDMVLFSYHGLPERQIKKSCQIVCDSAVPCPDVDANNHYCYRAQCYNTTKLIALQLGLMPDQYTVAYQSRVGKTPWVKPYTDMILSKLIKQGVKNLAVTCPSFVADCLETLEEINIRLRDQWQVLGGESFLFVPALNDDANWVSSLCKIIR